MRKALVACAVLAAVALAMAGWTAWKVHSFLSSAPETPGREVIFTVEPGQSFDQVARLLARENLVTNVKHFRMLARYDGKVGAIKAGEFSLNTGWTPRRLLAELTSGRVRLHRLSIPEGLTWWQVGRIVEHAGLGSFESFERAVHDRKILERYHIPFESAEGFLYPETYHFPRPHGGDATPVVRAMLAMFWKAAGHRLWPNGLPSPEELRRIVTLASMVEKETGTASERPRIAGVYANRLKIGMLMQCDPTVIYGLGTAFDGNLTRKHLRDETNPYNTYKLPGLPYGPICSPGLQSLEAAMNPEPNNFIFFVAKGDGSHFFSATLDAHNRAVRQYQLGMANP
ncbi:UPF0755 protein [Desulfobaculum xiamenense]|uniref:Endolytic murein transglycosylase n=1 Tax=Desulfobaculum xiamenense TaxID=995050 RepID=A0A846QMP2_9BACT|nr:endolytic transglycosylase MltG [Desulfobaculum xiamenense]NJB67732.1 UPF0755 protein [Desulfobaculum xiamenense]